MIETRRMVIAHDAHTIPSVCVGCKLRYRLKVANIKNSCKCGNVDIIDITKFAEYDDEWVLMHHHATANKWLAMDNVFEVSVTEKYHHLAKRFFSTLNNAYLLSIEYLGIQKVRNDANGFLFESHIYRVTKQPFTILQKQNRQYPIYTP